MKEQSPNSIIQLLKDKIHEVKNYNVYSEDAIYRSDYYKDVLEHIGDLSVFNSSDPNSLREQYLKRMKSIIDAGAKMGEEYKAKASFYNLYLYPIRQNFNIYNKTYSNYNIDIDFFNEIKEINTSSIYEGEYGKMYMLDSFSFTKNKLTAFILYNIDNGMKYKYNSKYELEAMIFIDGYELKIDINKKPKKSTKKG